MRDRFHATEERHVQTLLRRRSLRRVPVYARADEIQSLRAGVWYELLQRRRLVLWKPEPHPVRQFHPLRPRLVVGSSVYRANLINLILFAAAWEQRPKREQLGGDDTDGENVDWRVVVRRPEQHLGRAVPPRGDVIRVRGLRSDLPRQSKISQLDDVVGDEEVLRLEVPVEVPMLVQIRDGLQNLIYPTSHAALGEVLVPVLDLLVQVLRHVLEHEVQLIVFPNHLRQVDASAKGRGWEKRHRDGTHLLELHYVRVIELPERFDLTQSHALLPRVKLALHLLDGNDLVALPVGRLPHTPVRSISELLYHLVPGRRTGKEGAIRRIWAANEVCAWRSGT